jgi:hypothetical protein
VRAAAVVVNPSKSVGGPAVLRSRGDSLRIQRFPPEQPGDLRGLEARLLERYHAGLCTHGVTDYSLERLWEDYRLSVIDHLAIAIWQQTLGLPPAIWWSHLHRIIAAFEDLDCATLLA